MVILFSERNSKTEKEIAEILENYGVNRISDKLVHENHGGITQITVYKRIEVLVDKGIAVFTDECDRFNDQKLPIGTIGICEENNKNALKIFKSNNISAITYGSNNKNTVSLSSIGESSVHVTIQRTLTDIYGNLIEPGEYKLSLSKRYSPFSVMATLCILLISGIKPLVF